ncbi:MAG TPA: tetratricopeptide repeat protein [Vulgatibacter sp.]|nr:tetratricopeptide repeat protein [Vulgatibacter sp.]
MSRRNLIVLAAASLLAACGPEGSADELASRAIAEATANRFGVALELFDQALAREPDNLKALYNGGLAHLYLRRGDAAARRFESFVALRPNDALGHFNLARAYAIEGRREPALASLKRAVELGFDRHEEIVGGGFEAIEDDVRFTQIEALVAQRAGVGFDASRRNGVGAYGGEPLRANRLPGQRINVQCKGPKVPPGVAGNLMDIEQTGCIPQD